MYLIRIRFDQKVHIKAPVKEENKVLRCAGEKSLLQKKNILAKDAGEGSFVEFNNRLSPVFA